MSLRSAILAVLVFFCSACDEGGISAEQSAGSGQVAPERVSQDFIRSLESAHAIFQERDDQSGDWLYFDDSKVKVLYAHSSDNMDAIKAATTSSKLDSDIQILAVRMAQCLSLSEYLALLHFALAELERGKLRPEVMEALITPGAEWGTSLSLAYEDASVIQMLVAISQSQSATSGIRESVDSVLSGSQAGYIKAYAGSGEQLPRMSCSKQ